MSHSKVVKNTRKPPNAGKGRKKGVPNKTTMIAKEAIAAAADALGGADRLAKWAKESTANERVFWGTIYPKLLPLQVTGEGGSPIKTDGTLRIERVIVRSPNQDRGGVPTSA